jgi:hypothetical protein
LEIHIGALQAQTPAFIFQLCKALSTCRANLESHCISFAYKTEREPAQCARTNSNKAQTADAPPWCAILGHVARHGFDVHLGLLSSEERDMIDPKMLDDMAKKLANSVPAGVRELQQDLEKNFHATLQSTFNKLDLVTREEFEVQSALLARTRAKLDALQNQVEHLEQQLKEDQSNSL